MTNITYAEYFTLWVTFDKDGLALKVLEIYICSVPFVKIYLLENENQKNNEYFLKTTLKVSLSVQ